MSVACIAKALPLDLGLSRPPSALLGVKVVVLFPLAPLLEIQTQSLLEIRWRWESLESLALVRQSRCSHAALYTSRA